MPPLVEEVRSAPKWLDRLEQRALLRAVERGGVPRDVALITLMLNIGLRISEVAAMDIEDLTLGERSGSLKVRQGKGGKYRTVPLNSDARKALKDYLNGRTNGPIFLSQRGRGTKRLTASGIRQIIGAGSLNQVKWGVNAIVVHVAAHLECYCKTCKKIVSTRIHK